MIQRILNSKNFVASILAATTGMALYFKLPFPAENDFLQLMALRAPLVHEGFFYSYNLFLFTTPYIAYSIVLSGLYVFGLTVHKKIRRGKLPLYPDPSKREALFLIVAPRRPSSPALFRTAPYCFRPTKISAWTKSKMAVPCPPSPSLRSELNSSPPTGKSLSRALVRADRW